MAAVAELGVEESRAFIAKAARKGRRRDEDRFVEWMIHKAQVHGYLAEHHRPARTATGWATAIVGDKGALDITVVGHGRHIESEAKSRTGRLTPEQRRWLAAWSEVPGVELYFLRVGDEHLWLRILIEGPQPDLMWAA